MQLPVVGKVRRPLPWIVGAVLVGTLGLSAIVVSTRNRAPSYDLDALTVPVEQTALTVRNTASGTVKPVQTVNLSPKSSGILERLFVEQGDRVVQGQIIAQMESRGVEAQLRQNQAAVAEAEARLAEVRRGNLPTAISQAQARLDAAQAQVEDARARVELAEEQLARNRQLAQSGAISENELDTFVQAQRSAIASLRSAEFQAEEARQRLADVRNDPQPEAIAQAEARLLQAQAQLEATQVLLEETRIRAPFSGIITQRFATEGAFVTPTTSASDASSATSTAIVALASDLEIVAEVPEADIAEIRPGQAVEIRADAFPDDLFEGVVQVIAPEAIERQNVTLFQVRIDLRTGEDQLLSNMNVTVAFIGEQVDNALVVPTVAVITQAGRTGVLVPGDQNRIRFKPVTLGSQTGDRIQILEGLAEDDRVFVDLPPGQTLDSITFGQTETTPQTDPADE